MLPAAGVAALVVCAFGLLGRWAGSLASAAAVVVAFLCGNFTLGNLTSDDPKPTWANTGRLLPWKLADDAVGYEWLLRAALLLLIVGLVSRWLGLLVARSLPERQWWGANVMVWAPRLAAVFMASGWLTLGDAAKEWPWLRWQLAGAMIVGWVALDGVARSGAGAQAAAYQAVMLLTGGMIILYAHSLKSAELAIVLGSAMFGVAVATAAVAFAPVKSDPDAWMFDTELVRFDTSGAVPATVAFLPGLLLGARPWQTVNDVPDACFLLVAFAPAVLLLFVIPAVARKTGLVVALFRAALVLAPLVAAVVIASRHAQMAFE